jgi:hypothetical protein
MWATSREEVVNDQYASGGRERCEVGEDRGLVFQGLALFDQRTTKGLWELMSVYIYG